MIGRCFKQTRYGGFVWLLAQSCQLHWHETAVPQKNQTIHR